MTAHGCYRLFLCNKLVGRITLAEIDAYKQDLLPRIILNVVDWSAGVYDAAVFTSRWDVAVRIELPGGTSLRARMHVSSISRDVKHSTARIVLTSAETFTLKTRGGAGWIRQSIKL